jgi:hypothetical protein
MASEAGELRRSRRLTSEGWPRHRQTLQWQRHVRANTCPGVTVWLIAERSVEQPYTPYAIDSRLSIYDDEMGLEVGEGEAESDMYC